jgi:hypothetical protein
MKKYKTKKIVLTLIFGLARVFTKLKGRIGMGWREGINGGWEEV